MKVVTREQMQDIDKTTPLKYGLPSIILMENAGIQVVSAIKEYLRDRISKIKIAVLCGSGNNGGDGFVVARHLITYGVDVSIYLFADEKKIKGDALTNLNIAKQFGIPIYNIGSEAKLNSIIPELKNVGLIVDALLGTGISGEVKGLFAQVIDTVNTLNVPVIAVDIPSGLDADTGVPLGRAIHADITVTFGLPKIGLLIPPGIEYTGRLKIVDISFPLELIHQDTIKTNLITKKEVVTYIPYHPVDAHKGSCGKVFFLAGSIGMTGAAFLCSYAGLYVGAGMVFLGIPAVLNNIMEQKLTEVITLPLPDTAGHLNIEGYERIIEYISSVDAVGIGPGVGRNTETLELIKKVVLKLDVPMVIDADAIFALSTQPELLKEITVPVVITPHPGEMANFLGCSIEDVCRDRIGIARKVAAKYNIIVVLKGARSIIATPNEEVWINPTGNQGMATAGCGDVLTGMIAGFIAQGISPVYATKLSVFLHGLAGDIKAEDKGMLSLIATDILNGIPEAIKSLKDDKVSQDKDRGFSDKTL